MNRSWLLVSLFLATGLLLLGCTANKNPISSAKPTTTLFSGQNASVSTNPAASSIPSTPTNTSLPPGAQMTGKASCSNGTKTSVVFYHDPYCPACVANDPFVNKFIQARGDSTNVSYRIVVTHSRELAKQYGNNEVFQAHDYHICAQEQGKIQEFKECFYKNLKSDGAEYIPLKTSDLRQCAIDVKLDQDVLDKCLLSARLKLDANLVEAANFGGGSFFTPMVVVDCQVRVNSALAEKTYCAITNKC